MGGSKQAHDTMGSTKAMGESHARDIHRMRHVTALELAVGPGREQAVKGAQAAPRRVAHSFGPTKRAVRRSAPQSATPGGVSQGPAEYREESQAPHGVVAGAHQRELAHTRRGLRDHTTHHMR